MRNNKIIKCRKGTEMRRDPSPASRLYQRSTRELVHEIFPINRRPVHPAIVIEGRPPWPFPFTLPVPRERREEVRGELERAWDSETRRQIDPTTGTLMRALQYRAVIMFANGWRRSRRTGKWLLLGDEPSNSVLRSETQVITKLWKNY